MSRLQAERERCEVCRWWRIFDASSHDCIVGFCHRYPPIIPSESEMQKRENFSLDEDNWFPIIRGQEFCGEFQRKDGILRGPTP